MTRYDFTPWLVVLGFLYLGWVFRRELAVQAWRFIDYMFGRGPLWADVRREEER